jgi:hypothetical protein
MYTSRLVVAMAVGAVLVMGVGGTVAATASTKPSSAKGCVSQSGALSLIHHGKCAAHTAKIRLGAHGPRGARGPRGLAGPPGEGPLYYNKSFQTDFDSPGTSDLVGLSIPTGDYLVTVEGTLQDSVNVDGMIGECSLTDSNPKPVGQGVAQFEVLTTPTVKDEALTLLPFGLTGYATGPGDLEVSCTTDDARNGQPASDPVDIQASIIATRVQSIDDESG